MEQKRTLSSWISARRYIRDFAADYAARHGEDAAEIEKDILQAKKRSHISLNEYEWVGYHDRTEAQKRTMSTLWTRAEFRKNFTDRRYIAILMNKYIFSKVFSDFYGRRCVQASAVDAALLRALAGDAGKVVYKPNCKGQGTAVRILPAGDRGRTGRHGSRICAQIPAASWKNTSSSIRRSRSSTPAP